MAFELLDIFENAVAGGYELQTPNDDDFDGEYLDYDGPELTPAQERLLDKFYRETEGLENQNYTSRHRRSQAEKEHDRDLCGRVARESIDPLTGKLKARRFFCQQWQDGFCPTCAKYRADKLHKRLVDSYAQISKDGKVIKMATMSEAESRGYARQAGKANYMRMPIGNDQVVMFMSVEPSNEFPGTIVDDTAIRALDWLQLSNSKNGNLSGSLGIPVVVKENPVEVEIKEVILDADLKVKLNAWRDTLLETLDQQVTTEELQTNQETLQSAINARIESYVSKVLVAGGKLVKEWTGTREVESSHIKWLSITATDLETYKIPELVDGYMELVRSDALRGKLKVPKKP